MVGRNGFVKKDLARDNFLLLSPDEMNDAERMARAMAVCRGVKRVFMTSGEYGFIVSTKNGDEYCNDGISRAIKKAAGNARTKVVKSHFVYTYKAKA